MKNGAGGHHGWSQLILRSTCIRLAIWVVGFTLSWVLAPKELWLVLSKDVNIGKKHHWHCRPGKMAVLHGWKEGRTVVPWADCTRSFIYMVTIAKIYGCAWANMVPDRHAVYSNVHADTAQSRWSRCVGKEHPFPHYRLAEQITCFYTKLYT